MSALLCVHTHEEVGGEIRDNVNKGPLRVRRKLPQVVLISCSSDCQLSPVPQNEEERDQKCGIYDLSLWEDLSLLFSSCPGNVKDFYLG